MTLEVLILFAAETFAGVEFVRDCSATSGFSPWGLAHAGVEILNGVIPGGAKRRPGTHSAAHTDEGWVPDSATRFRADNHC